MDKAKEAEIYAVMTETGELTRLVQAQSKAQVKAFLLHGIGIEKASALTAARGISQGMKVEVAKGE